MVSNSDCEKIVEELSQAMPIYKACNNLGLSRSTYYYWISTDKNKEEKGGRINRKSVPWSLSEMERKEILTVMNSEQYFDKPPNQIYPSLLDQGIYLCSVRTMYRILELENLIKERRMIRTHTNYSKPELLAQKPNEVWSWDITKLKGPSKWTYFYLYVILDIFSRYVIGWMTAYRENSRLAEQLIAESCERQYIPKGQLTIHADRGSSMTSKAVALLLSDLGVVKSHSRPYQSNDNPYSESQFKTLKYCPDFPERFQSIEEARVFCRRFFNWYNKEHYHSGLGYFTPESVHYGYVTEIIERRKSVLLDAYDKNPERFRSKRPEPKGQPVAAWINKPGEKIR